MAHLFEKEEEVWMPRPLEQTVTRLGELGLPEAFTEADVRIVRFEQKEGQEPHWALLWTPGVSFRINGKTSCLGLRMLQDHDELRISNADPLFFSTEELPKVVAFPGQGQEMTCPRCQDYLEPGESAIRCPGCRQYYHADPNAERDCFHYGNCCLICGYAPAEEGAYRWTPTEVYP